MKKKEKAQFIEGSERLYDYAERLEKEGIDSDLIALAMLHLVAFYAVKRGGPEWAAQWLSTNVNIALEEGAKKGKMED